MQKAQELLIKYIGITTASNRRYKTDKLRIIREKNKEKFRIKFEF